jgi:hypothetical protein
VSDPAPDTALGLREIGRATIRAGLPSDVAIYSCDEGGHAGLRLDQPAMSGPGSRATLARRLGFAPALLVRPNASHGLDCDTAMKDAAKRGLGVSSLSQLVV